MAVVSLIAAFDLVTGNHLGIGKEFEKGIMLLGTLTMSMVGMLLIAPVFARLLLPFTDLVARYTHFDPSVIMGMLLANDMGGAPLSEEIAKSAELGYFNGLVVASMLGATISFTIPFAINTIKKEYHSDVFIGVLSGIATVPIGSLVAGIIIGIPLKALIINMIPLVVFSLLVMLGLWKKPLAMVKIFSVIGKAFVVIITLSLALGIFEFLTGKAIIKGLDPLTSGMKVVINASAVMTGAFPIISLLSRLLNRPLTKIGNKVGLDKISVLGFLSSMATVATTFLMIPDMNKKGRIANIAFSVSGAFVFAGHLAFTMSMNADYVFPVIVGKLISGFTAIIVSFVVYKKFNKAEE